MYCRITPQLSGPLTTPARTLFTIMAMTSRAYAAADRRAVQRVVIRQAAQSNFTRFFSAAHSRRYRLIRF